jgi:hypothetical protein
MKNAIIWDLTSKKRVSIHAKTSEEPQSCTSNMTICSGIRFSAVKFFLNLIYKHFYWNFSRKYAFPYFHAHFTTVTSNLPITVAARSKAWTVFARSNTGIVSSNRTQGMDVFIVCIYSVFVLSCVGRGLAAGWSPIQGVLPIVYRLKKLKTRLRPNQGL